MKKAAIIIGFLVLAMVTAIVAFVLLNSHSKPEGEAGPKAEQLADEMLAAMGYDAYQNLKTISWSFPRGHHFVWNKAEDSVLVKWGECEVNFSTKTLDGTAILGETLLAGEEKKSALNEAWAYFANDSFWLVAPFKIRDPGTTREYVTVKGREGLLVHYSSGGVTPGDSYLWILGEDKKPMAWRMWTQILPIDGLEFSWQGWAEYQGAWLAPLHDGPVSLDLTNVVVR